MLDTNCSPLFSRDLPHDCRRGLFGGNGAVRVWSLVDAPLLPFMAVLACELEAGGSVGAHVQEQYPELVIGLAGSGTVIVNGHAAAFAAGSVVQLPRGHTLAIDNAGDAVLRYLIVKSEGAVQR